MLNRIIIFNRLVTNYNYLKMNHVFVQKFNPLKGTMEWDDQLENYDYWQSIARSAYGDMVNDSERNRLYYKAIRKSVENLIDQQKQVNALDIGTGTGLLSMMCVESGAHQVTGLLNILFAIFNIQFFSL